MKICIRKEGNGLIYIDKTALTRFCEEELKLEPYNFKVIEIEDKYSDCEPSDFNEDLSFSLIKYNQREQSETNNSRISELKQKLSETDYQAIKFAEGQISAEDYEPIKQQRQSWRDEINRIEKN